MALKKVRNYYTSSLVSGTWRSEAEAQAAEDAFYASDAGKIQASREKIQDVLAQQILAQGTSSKWSGQGFGSAEANAKDMAKILAGIGITDIKQFGEVKKTVPADVQYTAPGLGVVEKRGDTYYKNESYEYGDGGTEIRSVKLTDAEAKNVKATYGRYVDSFVGEGDNQQYVRNFEPVDPAKIVTKDGVPSIETGETTYGNKATGQQVPNTYSERQTGNAWGGTFAGDGNTGYRVQFTPDGTPVFYTTYASSSDIGAILPIVSIALAATGAGAALGAALMGGTSVAATALGSGIISGVMAEASGGDFVKGAITGAVGAGIGAYAGDIGAAVGVTDPTMAKAVGNAIIQGSASAANGGDFIDGAIAGALSGASQTVGETLGLTGTVASSVGTAITKGVVAELQGKDVTDAMIAGAISGALSYKAPETTVQTAEEMDKTFQEDMAKLGITSTDLNIGPKTEDVLASSFQEDMTKLGIVSTEAPPPSEYQFTKDFGTGTDYSLTTGVTFPTEGIKVDEVKDAGATVGETPVDYGLDVTAPFEGLQMPTSPNIDSMGGGQGLTIETPKGVLSEEGITAPGAAPDLGDPNSFINKPAPDVPKSSPFDAKKALGLASRLLTTVGAGAAVGSALSSSDTSLQPVNLQYGDIYKDALIKGFSMRKGADGKYTPFIGEKAQLAKGGFISRR